MAKLNEKELLKLIIENIDDDISDEEVLHLILEHKVSKGESKDEKLTFGEKAADNLAKFAGSWTFIISFALILAVWIMANNYMKGSAFDPYPFILLNLCLSCTAAIQAPLIMMSQNRQEEKDRKRAENDYKVNLKTELIIKDLHKKLDLLIEEKEHSKKHKKNK